MNSPRWPLFFGALLTGLSIALAAMASHTLPTIMLDTLRAHRFETALQMQQLNGTGLLLIGIALLIKPGNRLWLYSASMLLIGICLFCGNLYLLSLTQGTPMPWLTPAGGLCLIGGWLFFALGAIRLTSGPSQSATHQ